MKLLKILFHHMICACVHTCMLVAIEHQYSTNTRMMMGLTIQRSFNYIISLIACIEVDQSMYIKFNIIRIVSGDSKSNCALIAIAHIYIWHIYISKINIYNYVGIYNYISKINICMLAYIYIFPPA